MSHLSKEFQEKSSEVQSTIVELGLHSWSLIEHYVDQQKNHSPSEYTAMLKKQLTKQKEKEIEEARQQKDKEYKYIIEELTNDLKNKETKCKNEFEIEKTNLTERIRLDVLNDFQKMRDDYITLKATLKAQGDFQHLCMKLSAEVDSLKEQNMKLTETKSSCAIGIDGENIINSLLSMTDFDYEDCAKEKGGHKGDFQIRSASNNLFILDSKKYTTNVNKKSKEKLMDDVDNDERARGGLFVAITSGIAKQKHGDIAFTKKNKPILYLSMMGMTEQAQLEVLKLGITLLDKYVNASSDEEKAEFHEKIKKMISGLSDLISRFKNIEKNAEDILKNAKIGIKDTEALLKEVQVVK